MLGMPIQNMKARNGIIWTLVALYVLSIVTCTVSFFTPYWLHDVQTGATSCHRVGLISGTCRFPYNTDVSDMERTFYCVLTAMLLLYTNASMTLAGYIYNLFDNMTYMAFLSVHYGLFYPVGAVLLLTSSIVLEAKHWSEVGASTVLCTISGGLMLLFYVGLRLYDVQHQNVVNSGKRK